MLRKTNFEFAGIVGCSPVMEKLFRLIQKVSQSHNPVLINGESGTGKELVARSIHFLSPQKNKPFIPVDCGSLVPTLIESELFGYVKGAFTGAGRSKDGLLTIAEGGTVFLDEVGELPIDLQVKLLRALQEKEIRPVGSTRRIPIDVRIVAATNRDLEAAVQQGTFRKDLYFRLNVVNLRIPPLRERKQDIPLLVAYILGRIKEQARTEKIMTNEAMELLMEYDWPGNVRELENCLERAFTLSSGPILHIVDLPVQPPKHRGHFGPNVIPISESSEEVSEASNVVPIAQLERQAILDTLNKVNGDKLLAARLLGIGKTTLYRKLKEYEADETLHRRTC